MLRGNYCKVYYSQQQMKTNEICDPLRRNETCPPDLTFIDMYTRLTSNSRAFQWYKCYFRSLFHSGIIERWREPSLCGPFRFLNFALRRKSTLNLDHTQSKRASYRSMYNSWIINQPLYQTPAVHTGPRLHSACCVWSRGRKMSVLRDDFTVHTCTCALSNSTVCPCIVPACTRETAQCMH